MIDKRQFYINGDWIAPDTPRDHEVINPSTEEAFSVISLGNETDTNKAVAAARTAFDSWSQTPKKERVRFLEKFLGVYEKRWPDMAQAISQEMGAPIDFSTQYQTYAGKLHANGFLKAMQDLEFDQMLGDYAPTDRILLEPIGVVGCITPWNWPMNQVTLKVLPAIAVGCTTVLKPSELSPLSAMVLAEILHDSGLPAGVFNLVNGDGIGVGTHLSNHPEVDMISFTGSTRAGIAIQKAAADTVKRVALELGGKGANIIFADADEQAIQRGVMHCMMNTGQSCNAPTRMLVQREIYDQAVATAAATANAIKVDSAAESGPHIGPVVSEIQWRKIQGLIQTGINEGARLIAGGLGRPEGTTKGYFVRPTIFADVNNKMTIAREELFGPVLSMIPFDTEEDAIGIANDTPYGLANYVQTQDAERAARVTRRLRAGMIEINGARRGEGSPFGGYKMSGNGREGGIFGLEEFLEVKAVSGWQV